MRMVKNVGMLLVSSIFVLFLAPVHDLSEGINPAQTGLRRYEKINLIDLAIGVVGFFYCKKLRLGVTKDNANWPAASGNNQFLLTVRRNL